MVGERRLPVIAATASIHGEEIRRFLGHSTNPENDSSGVAKTLHEQHHFQKEIEGHVYRERKRERERERDRE